MLKLPRGKKSLAPKPEQTSIEPVEDGHELRMSFLEHLFELRSRLLKAVIGLILATIVGAIITPQVLEYLIKPYSALNPDGGARLVILGPTGAVVSYFRVALLIGGIFASPIMTYQVMMFIIPGLKRSERRYIYWSIPPITVLFLIGVAFAWFILMPAAINFLEGFQDQTFQAEWTADLYIGFITSLLFWMGVSFEMPLVFFVFAYLGLITAGTLIRNWRFAIVGAAIAAAFITPTVDPFNMFLVMGPLLALYVLSIILVIFGRRLAGFR
jgi:sec-independent protein translocase protein TatC